MALSKLVGQNPKPMTLMIESSESEDETSDVEMVFAPVDFMEIYSAPRVCFAATRRGLLAPSNLSLDLTTGYDFMSMEARAAALRMVEQEQPQFLMLSPPCTMYSPLQQLFNLHKMSDEEKECRFLEADTLLSFGMHLCKKQHCQGRYFCFEHPQRASSWEKLRPGARKAVVCNVDTILKWKFRRSILQ